MIDKTDPTNRDTVPAMLTPGEFVLNKEASTMFAPVIEQMNDAGLQHRAMKNMGGGIQNYNKGGGVDLFDAYFENLLENEGGWSDQKQDRGGKTNLGITLKTLKNLSDPNATEEDLKSLTKEQAKEIYRKHYYYGPNIDSLPESIREQAFDIAVNSGPGTAARLIQELAGLKQDSIIGPNTIKGAEGITNNMLADRRQKFYNDIVSNDATQKEFIDGWTNRANSFREKPSETQPTSTEPVPKLFSGGGKDGIGNFGMIGDFFGGFTEPSVEDMSSPPPEIKPNTQANPVAIEQAIMQASVPQMQAVPPEPRNFNEAFRDARADMGAGGIFTFRGNDYTTNYAEEKDVVTANMGGSVYLNTGGLSIDQMARRKLQEDVDNAWFKRNERDALTKFDQANLALKKMPQKFPVPEPMQIDIDTLPMALPSGGSQQDPSMPDQGGPNRVPPMRPPMPDVNSDESLLKGSSGSIEQAFKSSPFTNVPRYNPDSLQAAVERGQGNYVSAPTVPEVRDPRELGSSEGYGQTGDATSRRAEAQRKLIAMREGLIPGSAEHIRVSNLITGAFTPSMTSLDELINYGALGAPDVPAYEGELGLGIPSLIAKPPITPAVNYSGLSFDALITLANDGDEKAQDELVQRNDQANKNDIEVDIRRNRGYSVENETPIDPDRPQITGELSPSVYTESQQLDVPLPEGVNFNTVGGETAVSSHEQAMDILSTPNLPEAEYTRANESLLVPDKVIPVDLSALDERGEGTGRQKFSSLPKVKAKVAEISGDVETTTPDQDNSAKVAADEEQARLEALGKGKAQQTPEVKGAMSTIKSVFGDLFDTKELMRAAIMYLGGRATGMSGNQALAFAGKNYIARTDAKTGAYQKIALEDKHTKESLAIFKKSMDFGDLVTKGLPRVPTGDVKTMYDRKTGREITLTEKKVGDGNYWFDGNKQVDMRTLTNDGRFAPRTADNATYKKTIRGNVESLVTSLDALNPSKNPDAKAGISELGIAKETIGREAVTFAIENGMELEQMEELVEKAYKEALVDAQSGKKISRLSDYFSRAWVESNTTDAQNFFLPGKTKDGKPIPVPAANVTTFLRTIKNAAASSGKQELANMSDTQVSSWLMSTESYKSWQTMDPDLKKDYIKTGAASGRSGMMEYILSGMVS